MYKVLLVDDENNVLSSLKLGVDWRKAGFEVIGKANSGDEALRMTRQLKPHVVFTDIKMPGISGLELIRKIKEMDQHIQFIVISGYAEFDYAQKSLQYGVLGYCLKPFDEEEIEKLLARAAGNLHKLQQENEMKLMELLEDDPTETVRSAFDRILADKGLLAITLCVMVSFGKGRLSFDQGIPYIAIYMGSGKYVYFVDDRNEQHPERSIVPCIPEGILGVGGVKAQRSMEAVVQGIEAATVKAWDFFIHGHPGVFMENTAVRDDQAPSLVKKIENAALKKNTALVKGLLDEIRTREHKDKLSIKDALNIYNAVYFHWFSESGSLPEEEYVFSKEQLYQLFQSFDSMIAYLQEFLNGIEASVGSEPGRGSRNATLKEIIKYIDENYRSDISIQSIAKTFFLNANYVSQLFTRELHITFTEYITNARLKEAKSLLLATERSIGEIAESIGFKDYFYFIRVFKKNTRMTPGQYRTTDGGRKA